MVSKRAYHQGSPRRSTSGLSVSYHSKAHINGRGQMSIGRRPAGFSRNSEISMSPKNASTSVRGIGVAVSTSMSTASPLRASASR